MTDTVVRKNFHVIKGISGYFLFQAKSFDIYGIDENTFNYFERLQMENADISDISVPKELSDLFASDLNDSHVNMLKMISAQYKSAVPDVNSLNIFLSGGCNLDCSYCFTDDSNQSKQKQLKSIDLDTGFRAIDFYFASIKDTGKSPAINFFGGEPLMYFSKLQKFVEYAVNHCDCGEKNISFYTTTNLTLLNDDITEFFKKYNFQIVVSLDGNEEIHDKNRRFKNGEGTYHIVWKNLQELAKECPDSVRIRATVCPSYTRVNNLVEHFRKSGVFRYGFELMYDTGTSDENTWTEDKIIEYRENFREYIASLYKMIIENNITEAESASVLSELQKLENKSLQFIPCQMGRESITISEDGYIYPCHWLVDSDEWRIGSLEDGFNNERKKSFPDLVFENDTCKNCWARFLCGGGCPSISIRNNNSKSKPDYWMCMDKKIRWEGYIALHAELLKGGRNE